MKFYYLCFLSLSLTACSTVQKSAPNVACIGEIELPTNMSAQFEATEDDELLADSIGQAEKGKLCQGKVFQSKKESQVVLYRAWNSTNPYSKLGNWWALTEPQGDVAQYRSDYEICYQWSPLDKMVRCTLKAGAKVVIGTGQSAYCSEYLSYPASAKLQVYIKDPANSILDCNDFSGEFNWLPAAVQK